MFMLDTHDIENLALICQLYLLQPRGLIVDVCPTVVPIIVLDVAPHLNSNGPRMPPKVKWRAIIAKSFAGS